MSFETVNTTQNKNTPAGAVQSLYAQNDYLQKNDIKPKKPDNNILIIQPKLTVGAPDDPYEKEADAVADKVMRMPSHSFVQRKCTDCENEEKIQRQVEEDETIARAKLINNTSFLRRKCAACEGEKNEEFHRKPIASGISPFIQTKSENSQDVSEGISSSIQNGQSSGNNLDEYTKSFMEGRFEADFSGVNIHTDTNSVQMNRELNAQAFTVGKDVYFNEGKYQPQTDEGKHLLAHELTHVVQQNSGLSKKSIQRYFTFAPDPRPKGSLIHSTVLPMFVENNADLFMEVRIPGAKKMDVDKGKTGIADFYKALPQSTIGIKFDEEPEFLTKDTKLQWGGGKYDHNKNSAPQGTTNTPRVRSLDNAPSMIELGDLKPGGSGESVLGMGQVKDYQDGIRNTASDINKYLIKNPNEKDSKLKSSWNPIPTTINHLMIPPVLTYPTGKGIARGKLAVYKGDNKFPYIPDSSLTGSMYVYKDKAGVWSYEWIPATVSASTGSGQVNEVLKRLNTEVIPPLLSSETSLSPKRIPQSQIPQKKEYKTVRRKEDKFKDEDWKTKYYTPWKQESEKFLGNEKEVKKAQVAETLVELKGRTDGAVHLPSEVEERGKGLSKISHWKKFGGLYGWLREKFGFIFVKVQKFANKIKAKVKALSKKVGGTSFGSWVKAAAKVVFKIFKMVGAWVVGQVLDKLIDSLKEGLFNNIKKLIDMITPDDVKAKIQEFEELKEKYQKIIEEKEDELIKRFFGNKLEFFEKLEEFEKIANTLSTIATLVEWGVRLLACASPPALGCLWNLAISALQAAFAWLMQTCWFTKKVYEPVISNVDLVRNFPTEIAAKIVNSANEYIPVPEGFDPIFAPITINNSDFKVECDESGDGPGGLTSERSAIMDLIDEIGPDKFHALLDLSLKRGAGPWVLLTAERLAELKEALKEVSTEELKAAAKDSSKGTPVPLDDFLKDIKSYSGGEKKLIKEAGEAKKAKEAAEAAKGGVGKGVEPDNSQKPIYGKPDKLDDTITGILYACVIDGSKLEPGKTYPDPVKIYLGVYFKKNGKLFKLIINEVGVKIKVVEKDLIEFINQKDFYAKYDDDDKLIFFPKDKIIKIAKDSIIYTSDL